MIRSPRHAARRVRQTMHFANGPEVLTKVALVQTPWRSEELTFELGGGASISCPNVFGARVPVYEVFAEDSYRIVELTDGLRPDFLALDVGAQVGCFTVAIATCCPQARVDSYEASPTTLQWLDQNVRLNDL